MALHPEAYALGKGRTDNSDLKVITFDLSYWPKPAL